MTEESKNLYSEFLVVLIKLYNQYLAETIKERTHITPISEKQVLFKGDFDGFINWLKIKNNPNEKS